MKLTGMQKILIAAAGIAVVFVVVVVLLILPMFGTLSELDQKQADAEALISTTQATLAQLQEAKGKAPETQAQVLRVSNQMPDSPQLPSLIVELQDACNDSGTKMAAITPGNPVYDGGLNEVPADLNYTEVPINLQVEGLWPDVLDLLRRLNKMTRVIRVRSISLGIASNTRTGDSTQPVEPERPALAVTLDLSAYVMGNNGVLVAPESVTASAPPPAEGGTTPAP